MLMSRPQIHSVTAHQPPQESAADLQRYYRDMLLIRRFEEKAGQLYGMGLIGGFCHLYIGQEAVVVGMQASVRPEDQLITAYRDHGHMLASGMDPKGVMAELTGRSTGYSKGKGGSMHMFSQEKKFYGGHGDGAANQGQVYESFNMAELWKLPVVYVIENNQYAMGTSVARSSAVTDFSKRGVSFNIPGVKVDGMDVEAVEAAGKEAMAHCRTGKGPIILEMKTYRYRGHSMSDPAKYRPREEVTEVREKRDPIENFGKKLIDRGLVNEQDLKQMDAEVKRVVVEAAEFATESPEPALTELYTDIYA